jgi:Oxygenase domain of the 2OGFeDO superfamily
VTEILTIRLTSCETDEWVQQQVGCYLNERHYDTVVGGEPVNVLKPSGEPLLMLRPRAIPNDIATAALPALRNAGRKRSEHRGMYGGIVGYYDQPDCRTTAFTRDHMEAWVQIVPYVRAANNVFRRTCGPRYAAQRRKALRTARDWIIGHTAFTTITVNLWDEYHDARTRVHVDDGDLREGFGVISVLRSGSYKGGSLIFPKYRVAVDLESRDVLLCDVHEHHGNAPLIGQPGWERIATILYYREAMARCAKPEPNARRQTPNKR